MQELVADKLYSFDERVRVELGPQIIELDCTDDNLRDEVTAPHYKRGRIDARGKKIDPDAGGKMDCVDWRAKHVPHVWKIYQLQETEDLDKEGSPDSRFIQVGEDAEKDAALASAQALREGME